MAYRRIKTLRAISSNPGIRAAWQRNLDEMIRDMHKDVFQAVLEEFDAVEWRMARDGAWRSPSARLADRIERLLRKWGRRFRAKSTDIAAQYMQKVWKQVRLGRKNELAQLGLVVKVNPSRFTSELYQALLAENVSLIQSIPAQYIGNVERDVQRAISAGGDRHMLAKSLRKNYGVTENRARLIARDQTAKATQALAESTDRDLGFTEGVWVHVPGRKSSRPTHVAMNGKRFELKKGLYDRNANGPNKAGAWVKPGQLVCCMCTYRPVIPEGWKA